MVSLYGRFRIHSSPFIKPRLGATEIDCVISELCYEGIILQMNCGKMIIIWSFSYNSFVKFHGKNIWEPLHDHVIFKSVF